MDPLKKMAMRSCLAQKHGACLLQGNKIFSFGVNKYFRVNLTDDKEIPISIHAEVDALSCIHSKFVKGMDILIIRVNKSQKLIYSRPCNSCIEKLRQKGIRKAYYSTRDGNIVYEFVDTMPKTFESSSVRNRRCEKPLLPNLKT